MAWYDPATGRRIATFEDERTRADAAEARVYAEQARAAEARVRELEEQVRRPGPCRGFNLNRKGECR